MKTSSPTPRLLKPKEAAAYLAISERKLWQLTSDNKVPAVKYDRVVRYDIVDLDAFISRAKGGIC
jgi:excisionase family DNA binding protein